MSPAPRVTVDTSVVVKWFFDEPGADHALRLREQIEAGRYVAMAPDLIYPELANVIWKRVLFEGLDPEDGADAIAAVTALPVEIVSSLSLLAPAYRLAVELRQSVYDGLFLAASLAGDADFVTADEALWEAVKGRVARVHRLAAWPVR